MIYIVVSVLSTVVAHMSMDQIVTLTILDFIHMVHISAAKLFVAHAIVVHIIRAHPSVART